MTEQDFKAEKRPWDTNHEGLRQIFCAALQGACARNGTPQEIVEFADLVVLAAVNHHNPA